MTSLVIDTSALIAILSAEPEAELFMQALDGRPSEISTATLHEAHCVATRSKIPNGKDRLERLIELVEPRIFPFDLSQLSAAKTAYSLYGRGTGHSANLNMGDCFAYALAKTRGLPLLFKGGDFIHTDLTPAAQAAASPSAGM